MATIDQLIDSARFDLRDYQTGLEWDDAELILFINRMIRQLDSQLASLNSDLVFSTASLSLGGSANSLDISSSLNSGNWVHITRLWRGQERIQQESLHDLLYRRLQQGTGTGAPDFWALHGQVIEFDKTSDQAYTLTCWYYKQTGTVTGATSTPYGGLVDDWLRELLVAHARAKKEGSVSKSDMQYGEMAKKKAMELHIGHTFVPKPYRLDF
jgi:hypothetical protein